MQTSSTFNYTAAIETWTHTDRSYANPLATAKPSTLPDVYLLFIGQGKRSPAHTSLTSQSQGESWLLTNWRQFPSSRALAGTCFSANCFSSCISADRVMTSRQLIFSWHYVTSQDWLNGHRMRVGRNRTTRKQRMNSIELNQRINLHHILFTIVMYMYSMMYDDVNNNTKIYNAHIVKH